MDLERQERDPRAEAAVDPPPPRVAKAKEAKVKEARIIIMDHPIAVTRTTMDQKEKLERTKTPPP